jgi:hypothetical protein
VPATRPSGQAVPRDGVAAGTTTAPATTTSRPVDTAPSYGSTPYGTSPTTSSAQPPRPIGQPVQRDASTSSRPVPPPPTTEPTQPQPAQPAPAGRYVLNAKGQPVDPHAKSATESCGSRVFVALAICMEERCEDSRWRNGDDCVRILERKRQRQSR